MNSVVDFEFSIRRKLISHGAKSLSDEELVYLLITPFKKFSPQSNSPWKILRNVDSARDLLDLDFRAFRCLTGANIKCFQSVQAIKEILSRRLPGILKRRTVIKGCDDTAEFLKLRLNSEPSELFCILLLDNQHRVISFEPLFQGTINGAQVYPRIVLQRCLLNNAAALILAHNHPSGLLEPSESDIRITKELKQLLAKVDVRLLDHFIIADNNSWSFACHGLI